MVFRSGDPRTTEQSAGWSHRSNQSSPSPGTFVFVSGQILVLVEVGRARDCIGRARDCIGRARDCIGRARDSKVFPSIPDAEYPALSKEIEIDIER
jgi:hypothetical protein